MESIQDSVETVLVQSRLCRCGKGLHPVPQAARKDPEHEVLRSWITKISSDSYVKVEDWRVKENSTVTYSVGGLILSNSGAVTANYWLV